MPYALALAAAALYGMGDFLGGFASRRASLFTVAFVSQSSGLVGLAFLIPVFSSAWPPVRDLAWGTAAGFAGGVGLALLYRGLAIGLASVVAPITAVCSIIVPVLVDFATGARLRLLVGCGIATAMIAVALLSQGSDGASANADRGRATKGIGIAIVSGVAIGVFLTCLGRTSPLSGVWPLIASRVVGVVGFGLACLALGRTLLPAADALRPSIVSGLLDVGANTFYLLAVRGGSLGPIATLVSLYPASTVALASVVWRERLRPIQIAGLALAFVAIVLITWPAR